MYAWLWGNIDPISSHALLSLNWHSTTVVFLFMLLPVRVTVQHVASQATDTGFKQNYVCASSNLSNNYSGVCTKIQVSCVSCSLTILWDAEGTCSLSTSQQYIHITIQTYPLCLSYSCCRMLVSVSVYRSHAQLPLYSGLVYNIHLH